MKFGNTKTHFCIGIAAAVLVMLLLTVGAFAAEEHGGVVDSGKCGENLTWMLYKDGLLQISGTGKMDNYDSAFGYMPTNTTYAPWHFYRGQINRVNLGSGITTIGDCAFHDCTGFTGSLTIPNSVTSIGSSAFSGCTGFTGSLTIPDSVTTIGLRAFQDCSGLTGSLTIPNSVTSIGNFAFLNCFGFTGSLTIPNSVTSIGNGVFKGCSGLTGSLTIPNSVESIGSAAFSLCSGFTEILTIPNSVTSIGGEAFYRCTGFTGSLTIPDSVTTIGLRAFQGCTGFTGSLTIGNSVTSIEEGTFYDCSGFTGSLTIGNSVTTIGYSAFQDCSGFTGNLTIPNSVTSIGDTAFEGCSGFTGSLTIPDNVSVIGIHAFSSCSGLTDAVFKGNAPTVGNSIFMYCADGFKVYCYKKYASSFITDNKGKWNGYPLIILDDAEPTPEVGLRLTGAVLDVGSSIRFSASVPAGDTVLWSSTDPNVASVENGTVTARSEGTAVIIAAAKTGGTSVSFEVTVNPAPEPVIKGDFDGDGHVTAKDRMILSRYLAGWPAYTKYFEQQ